MTDMDRRLAAEIAHIQEIAPEANDVIDTLTGQIRRWLAEGYSESEITLAAFNALERSDPRKVLSGCVFAMMRLARSQEVSA